MRHTLVPLALMLCCVAANAKPMSHLSPLLGSWSCVTTSDRAGEHGTATYRTVAGTDTLEFFIRSPHYTGAGYLGYDEKAGRFFSVTADAFEGTSTSHGSLRTDGMLALSGTVSYSSSPAPMRETLGLSDPHHLRDRTEMMQNGTWKLLDDTVCTRAGAR
jgi:hypothetical protein